MHRLQWKINFGPLRFFLLVDTLDQKRNEVEGKGRKGDRDGQTDMLPPAKLASKTKSKPKLEEETKYSFPPSLISPRPPFGVISE